MRPLGEKPGPGAVSPGPAAVSPAPAAVRDAPGRESQALAGHAMACLDRVRELAGRAGAEALVEAREPMEEAARCMEQLRSKLAQGGRSPDPALAGAIRRLSFVVRDIAMLLHRAGASKLALAHILLAGRPGEAGGASYTSMGIPAALPPWRRISTRG